MSFRIEKDPLGKKKVPKDALYGIHTQRAKENFQISGNTLSLDIFHSIAEIKIAAAQANMKLGLLDKKKGQAIVKAGEAVLTGKYDKEFVIDAYQAGEGTPTHMNVNEVIANLAIGLLKNKKGNYKIINPYDHVNMGQSTNNVVPSALKISSVKNLSKLNLILDELEDVLIMKGNEFKSVLKSGRTHLQDAVPITLGQEFHAYGISIQKNIQRIERIIDELKELNVGKNAVGTGINTHPDFTKKILKNLSKINKINWRESQEPIFSTQNISIFLEASDILKILAIDLNKIANDLRLLSSGPNTGLREINLPAVEPGSSIMPGKVNPSIAEMLSMVCYQVMGNDETVNLASQASQLELNVMIPVIAKNLLDSIDLLSNAVDTFTKKCVKGIKANEDVCLFYYEHSSGLATLLNPYIGYEKAAEVVQESLKTGDTISNILIKNRLITKDELERILDYRNVTKPNLKKRQTGDIY